MSTSARRAWIGRGLIACSDDANRRPYALITGASSGIGAAFARQLSEEGYLVGLVATAETALKTLADSLPGPALVLPTDLADPEQLRVLEQLLIEADPAVSLLVNNAATGSHGPFVEHDAERLSDTVLVNFAAVMRLTRAVLPQMIDSGRGSIINVSSPIGLLAAPRLAPYAATKAAVDSFTRTLQLELQNTGVVLTLVRPDWTRTGFHDRLGQDVAGVPGCKWQSPEVVARGSLEAQRRGKAVVWIPPRTLGAVVRAGVRRAVPARIKSMVRRSGWLPG